MVAAGKGVLAIDESVGTCNKRFEKLGIPPEVDARRAYRELLITTPRLGEWVSGVILFDETIRQSAADGRPFVEVLQERGIIPGIKVDAGTVPLPGCDGETITEGLDGLPKRVDEYYRIGARFAKWRAVISIADGKPSDRALAANAWALARYARIAQEGGLVPIVEPELLTEGTHGIETCYAATRRALQHVFQALASEGVAFRGMVLKPSMVTQGSESTAVADPATVARLTVEVLAETVPAAVAGVAFLSGGQDDLTATRNLQAMNELPNRYRPWPLTFSYGRAIQQAALAAWAGRPENVARAQELVAHRARSNAHASAGTFDEAMEGREFAVSV
jgi:fructose-bisphosphate aldolase class I